MQKAAKLFLILLLAAALSGCGGKSEPVPTSAPAETAAPGTPAPEAVEEPEHTEGAYISELMAKNHACLRSADGGFYDWIEISNSSDSAIELGGWQLTDKEYEEGFTFPDMTLKPGECVLVFASGEEGAEGELHASFSLSDGETVYLKSPSGTVVDRALCDGVRTDASLRRTEPDGAFSLCLYPTPGLSNEPDNYNLLQDRLQTPDGLMIYEVAVDNFPPPRGDKEGYYDWLELKNNSSRVLELSDYYLSDDEDDYYLWRLPTMRVEPGEIVIIRCPGDGVTVGNEICAPFKLNSEQEQLFLSTKTQLEDWVSLRDIPYKGSYGRIDGRNGFFFFAQTSRGRDNSEGFRRVSETPVNLTADGVFENADRVMAELDAPGKIYYTLDCSVPTAESSPYKGPVTIKETSVLRAVAVEEGCLPSRALTLSYFINENLSLPVLSFVTDDRINFMVIDTSKQKDAELPGNLAFYEEGGSFSIGCGIKLNGGTSLELDKKNYSFRFRGSYGRERLSYDIFGYGVTEFSNLLIRSGQDYYSAIIRSELAQELCLRSTDTVVCQRTRYCVVYFDGVYKGIYAIKDKANEQMYADLIGCDKDDVLLEEAPLTYNSKFLNEVVEFCKDNDMSKKENYEHFCDIVDVDSLIDWAIMEGYCCNDDLAYGNVRYVRSTEGDGKWRLVFFDLDSSFNIPEKNFINVFPEDTYISPTSEVLFALMDNLEFRDRFLTRAGHFLNTTLSDEAVVAVIDELTELIRPEVARDYKKYLYDYESWEANVEYLRLFITENSWRQHNIDSLCEIFRVSDADRAGYFGA